LVRFRTIQLTLVVETDVAVHMHYFSLDQDAGHRVEHLAEIASALVY